MVAHLLGSMVHGCRFYQHWNVSPGPDRHSDAWYGNSEDFHKLIVETQTFVFLFCVPFLKFNHKLDSLSSSNSANAEQILYVDDSQTPNLHVVLQKLACLSVQIRTFHASHMNCVICHQSMASFYKFESGFRFSNSALSHEQDAHPEYFYKHAMHGSGRRKLLDHPVSELHDEGVSALSRGQYGNRMFLGHFYETNRWLIAMRQNQSREFKAKEVLCNLRLVCNRTFFYESKLAFAKNLNAIICKILVESGESKARPIDVKTGDGSAETGLTGNCFELQAALCANQGCYWNLLQTRISLFRLYAMRPGASLCACEFVFRASLRVRQ